MKVLKVINLVISTMLIVMTLMPIATTDMIDPYGLFYLGVWQFGGNLLIMFIAWTVGSKSISLRNRGIYLIGACLTLLFIYALGDIEMLAFIPLALCAFGYTYICVKELKQPKPAPSHENSHRN